MQLQLDFWPEVQQPPPVPNIWQRLKPQDRVSAVATLARVISKMVGPRTEHRVKENKNERQ